MKNNTPKLRFKEFTDEWQEKILSKLARIDTGNKDTQDRVDDGKYPFFVRSNTVERISSYSYDGVAILTSGDGVGVGKNFHYIDGKFDYHQRVYAIKEFTKELNSKFFFQYFAEKFYRRVIRMSAKNSVDSVRMEMISKMPIPCPAINEQEKIAGFLGAVDEKIEKLEEKKKGFEKYKKGVMQAIFSQQIRFKKENGENYPDWEEKKLSELLVENNEKTTESKKHVVLSSTAKGIFRQDEYFNKEIASSDSTGYKIIHINQLVFSPQNLWLGNINLNRKYEIGIVSPSYKVFNIKKNCNIAFIESLLKSPRMMYEYAQISEQGASIVRRNLDLDSFKAIKSRVPSYGEQEKNAEFLTSLDNKVELISKELEQAKLFKKSLLQQMFV